MPFSKRINALQGAFSQTWNIYIYANPYMHSNIQPLGHNIVSSVYQNQ